MNIQRETREQDSDAGDANSTRYFDMVGEWYSASTVRAIAVRR